MIIKTNIIIPFRLNNELGDLGFSNLYRWITDFLSNLLGEGDEREKERAKERDERDG